MTEQDNATPANALQSRKRVKKNKPKFARQESWRYKRLKENWRRPRGLDNKMRRKIKGWPPTAGVGYRGPKLARGLHPSGYKEVLLHNVEELRKINEKTQAIRIAHTVGKRNRIKILIEAKKRKIIILNPKEAKEAVEERKELAEEETEEEKPEKEEEKAETKKPEKEPRKTKKRKTRTGRTKKE